MLVPPARNGQSLESDDSDDEGSDRELSGEVRSILSSRENVRQVYAQMVCELMLRYMEILMDRLIYMEIYLQRIDTNGSGLGP